MVVSPVESVRYQLISRFGDARTTVTGVDALDALKAQNRPDVLIVDQMVLTRAMTSLLRIRRLWVTVSIAVLKRDTTMSVSAYLDSGADEVLELGSEDFVARASALMRRARTLNAADRIVLGDIVMDREARRLWCDGNEIHCSPTEYAIIACFFWHAPTLVHTETLTAFVWGRLPDLSARNLLRVHLTSVRAKLSRSQQVRIESVRGFGYRLKMLPISSAAQ